MGLLVVTSKDANMWMTSSSCVGVYSGQMWLYNVEADFALYSAGAEWQLCPLQFVHTTHNLL